MGWAGSRRRDGAVHHWHGGSPHHAVHLTFTAHTASEQFNYGRISARAPLTLRATERLFQLVPILLPSSILKLGCFSRASRLASMAAAFSSCARSASSMASCALQSTPPPVRGEHASNCSTAAAWNFRGPI